VGAGRALMASSSPGHPPQPVPPFPPMLFHRFCVFLAGCTVVLLMAGSLVTSTGSGLSVPDWPTSYGWNMFTFPPSMWVGGIFYEHGHRLIASTVGLLTIVLTLWVWRVERRRWMQLFCLTALVALLLPV